MLVLRPQPGAGETALRIAELGYEAVVAPLFQVRQLDWEPPSPDRIVALLLTSANAPRQAGPRLSAFTSLPCYAVGEATAAAARAAGFDNIRVGSSDGAAATRLMVEEGVTTALHLCGREHVALEHPGLRLLRRAVYGSDAERHLPLEALAALQVGAVALLHSPRAASLFRELVNAAGLDRSSIRVAAISPAALEAAGQGWAAKTASAQPRDDALLEVAAKLCKNAAMGGGQ